MRNNNSKWTDFQDSSHAHTLTQRSAQQGREQTRRVPQTRGWRRSSLQARGSSCPHDGLRLLEKLPGGQEAARSHSLPPEMTVLAAGWWERYAGGQCEGLSLVLGDVP